AWGDVDNDGKLDLLVSGGTGPQPNEAFYYGRVPWNPFLPITAIYHNNTPTANEPPSTPSNVSTSTGSNGGTFSWDPATDDRTPRPVLSYNLRVGTAPGKSDIISPAANF